MQQGFSSKVNREVIFLLSYSHNKFIQVPIHNLRGDFLRETQRVMSASCSPFPQACKITENY